MKNFVFFLLIVISSVGFYSCGTPDANSPTQGVLKLSVDETLKPVIDSNILIFESQYKEAKIKSVFTNEVEAFNNLISDSSAMIVVTRKLNKDELKYFDQIKIVPHITKIAYDAIALICNKKNKDSLLSMNLIKDICSGKKTNWKEINKDSKLGPIQLIFESGKASTVRYMRGLINDAPLAKNSYEVKSCDSIINYVEKNVNSIGIIGVNWISDNSDSTSVKFLDKVTIMELNAKESFYKGIDEFFKPYQAYIATGDYPLKREVYTISREAFAGVATGFSGFMAAEKGQRIFLHAGLVPATMPVRLVEVKNRDINVQKEKK
jgi:hypothetical protein